MLSAFLDPFVDAAKPDRPPQQERERGGGHEARKRGAPPRVLPFLVG